MISKIHGKPWKINNKLYYFTTKANEDGTTKEIKLEEYDTETKNTTVIKSMKWYPMQEKVYGSAEETFSMDTLMKFQIFEYPKAESINDCYVLFQ